MCKILIYELYIRVLKFPEKNIENPLILNFIYTRTALWFYGNSVMQDLQSYDYEFYILLLNILLWVVVNLAIINYGIWFNFIMYI